MVPVETHYIGRDQRLSMEEQLGRLVGRILAEDEGSLLVFLPGQGEIRRTERARSPRAWKDPRRSMSPPLYGALEPARRDRAIAPSDLPGGASVRCWPPPSPRTSLTIQGVRVVIDGGQSRVPRFDPASGLTRLATVRVSRAAADQRRGRAGRTQPGVCYRLWDEAEDAGPAAAPSSGLRSWRADLSGLALDLARWGARDPDALALLDKPPAAAFAEARALLHRLQALDEGGGLTAHGAALADLPLPPRLAHMVLKGAAAGIARRAALIAALISEHWGSAAATWTFAPPA